MLGIILFHHLNELAIFGPAPEQKQEEAMIDKINEISRDRLIFGRLIHEVLAIEGWQGRGSPIQSKEGGRDQKPGPFVYHLLNPIHISRRKSER